MAKVIAVVNQKGGVGKTTTVFNLGAALAEMGHRVLLVDFDPQGSLTISAGIVDPAHPIQEALFDEEGDRGRFLYPTSVANLWVVPSSIDLAGVELALAAELNRERFLSRAVRAWDQKFDYVLIDNTPSLGLLVINAMAAADALLIPVQAEYLALRALAQLVQTIERVRSRDIQASLEIAGILLTMFNPRKTQCAEVEERLRQQFGPKVFRTVIRVRAQYSYAPVAGQPVTVFDGTSDAAEMYRCVARELTGVELVSSRTATPEDPKAGIHESPQARTQEDGQAVTPEDPKPRMRA